MEYLSQIYAIMLSLIVIGSIMRIAYCLIQIMINGDDRGQMVQRVKNALVFACISVGVSSFAYAVINRYFYLGHGFFTWF